MAGITGINCIKILYLSTSLVHMFPFQVSPQLSVPSNEFILINENKNIENGVSNMNSIEIKQTKWCTRNLVLLKAKTKLTTYGV